MHLITPIKFDEVILNVVVERSRNKAKNLKTIVEFLYCHVAPLLGMTQTFIAL